jgi:hypothetical protein
MAGKRDGGHRMMDKWTNGLMNGCSDGEMEMPPHNPANPLIH